jgi:hypothetical protein
MKKWANERLEELQTSKNTWRNAHHPWP